MQQADITAITRELAGLVAERYVFPGPGADLSQLLEDRLADGRYTRVPDEESLAATLTRSSSRSTATSTCASGTALANCPNAAKKRPSWPRWPPGRSRRRGGSPGPSGSTATSAISTCSLCCSCHRSRGRPWPPR